jgi:hypothetical protein
LLLSFFPVSLLSVYVADFFGPAGGGETQRSEREWLTTNKQKNFAALTIQKDKQNCQNSREGQV